MGGDDRTKLILSTLTEAFEPLMKADVGAFRTKFRKMAADPFAFYRGSACVFYADMRELEDRWADERTSRVWIHGDLHAENFGTYMNSEGVLTFDVNDFDEAYLGHFSWDLRRFVASLALMGWQKALPEDAVRTLAATYLRAYIERVHVYVDEEHDSDYALHLDNAEGHILEVLRTARRATRIGLLEGVTELQDDVRRLRRSGGARELAADERERVLEAFASYLETIPPSKRERREIFYEVKDVVGRSGFGIGSAGLAAYNVLIEGRDQAHENDVILTMKQGNVAAASRVVTDRAIREHFEHEGRRTVISQRALQQHTDPLLGYTTIDGVGFVVADLSPYEADLEWSDITEPEEIAPVVADLGRATAKIHCISDSDSDEGLVDFSTEEAIATVLEGEHDAFVEDVTDFAIAYAERARRDHALFVEAFRGGQFELVSAT
ncbi:MAG TPA: DUF2252 domain-containing protein [Solirubrobacteraceae bacterium]|nr:DUF2252 domain-containing protein [Solirubrobacteraceae bacterium]